MPFTAFLAEHYNDACESQRSIKRDIEIVEALNRGTVTPKLVRDWMQQYRLFQGVDTSTRTAVAKEFLKHARTLKTRRSPLSRTETQSLFKELLVVLFRKTGRGWISGASKLLWCKYPSDFVIYDSFVHRALIVLQSVDMNLKPFAKVGWPPALKTTSDIDGAVHHYMKYQDMVKHLRAVHQPTLDRLRSDRRETYPYDIRIVDRLLWKIGDADS